MRRPQKHPELNEALRHYADDMVDKIRRGEVDIFIAAGFKNVFELYLKNVADHDAVLMNVLHLENLL